MAVTVEEIKRVFILGEGKDQVELDDPNPNMSPEEVLQFYAPMYPDLNNADFEKEELVGNRYEYRIERQVGTKG